MDDKQIAVIVPAADDADMCIAGVKYQVPGLGIVPCDAVAIHVLCLRAASVTYDIFAVGHVVKHPVHKAGAVEAIGQIGSGGVAASRPNFLNCPPSGVPAYDVGFAAPEVCDLSNS